MAKQRHTQRARDLRKRTTRAEDLLWRALRNRQISGLKFRRQVPRGRYIVDFLCTKKRLVIEVDGATHGTAAERTYDLERTIQLEESGYRVVRFWNDEVENHLDGCLWAIQLACEKPPIRPGGDIPSPESR